MLKINNLKSVLYSWIYFLLRIYFSCIFFPPAKQRSPRDALGWWDAIWFAQTPGITSLSLSHPHLSDVSSVLKMGTPLVSPASAPALQGIRDGGNGESPACGIYIWQKSTPAWLGSITPEETRCAPGDAAQRSLPRAGVWEQGPVPRMGGVGCRGRGMTSAKWGWGLPGWPSWFHPSAPCPFTS